jgi:glucose-6-phosphate isomerase
MQTPASAPRKNALQLADLLRQRPAVLRAPLSSSASVPLETCGLRLDLSGQRVGVDDLAALQRWAVDADVRAAFAAMVRGELVNPTEHRAALHTALRARPGDEPAAPASVQQAVAAERERLRDFAMAVRSGAWAGAGGQPISDVINIGIGGSDAGPRLVCEALRHVADGPRVHFVSNVDGSVLVRLLPDLDPATTLAIVSSKSFSTRETLLNAATVRAWLEAAGVAGSRLARHMVVVSAREGAAASLGLSPANQFPIWDWVGGRFSVWSAVGLPALLSLGPERFDALLDGARDMDRHALESPLAHNLPATMALLEIWNSAVLQMPTLCVLPYDDRLAPMLGWLQQLQMESLGKSRRVDGALSDVPTGPVVWGGIGTDAQHTFLQLLRQGTARTAVDVICVEQPDHGYVEHHKVLVANAHAQVEALVAPDADSLGANAVSLISIDRLTPERLGCLMALYEHKVVMEAAMLGINAFDQPGVELAKALARKLERNEP